MSSRSSTDSLDHCASSRKSLNNIWILRSREVNEREPQFNLVAQLHQMLYNFNQDLIPILNSLFFNTTSHSITSAKLYLQFRFKKLSILILDLILIIIKIIITRLVKFSYSSSSSSSSTTIHSLQPTSYFSSTQTKPILLLSLCQDSRQNCVTI